MKKTYVLMSLIVLFSAGFALNVTVTPDKQAYGPNEIAKIGVLVSNGESNPVDVNLQFNILMPDESTTLGQIQNIIVGASQSKTIYFNFTISLTSPPGKYTAIIGYFANANYSEATAYFEVSGTNPPISFYLVSCSDNSCVSKKQTFVTGDTAYIKVESELSEPTINASLKKPDGTTQPLPFVSNIANTEITKDGLYEATVTLSKEGHSSTTGVLQFAAISENVQISSASKCNANGICDSGETTQNCPQDCTSAKLDYLQYIQWGVIAFLAVFVIILLAKRRPKQEIVPRV